MAYSSANLISMVSPQFKTADVSSTTFAGKKSADFSSDFNRGTHKVDTSTPVKETSEDQHAHKVDFEEVLDAEITLREALRKLEAETDQNPEESLKVSFNTSILEGGEGLDQDLSFMPTSQEFEETLTDIQETVEISDEKAAPVESGEIIAAVQETTLDSKKDTQTVKESDTVDPKLLKKEKGSDTLTGGETDDHLKVKDAKDKKEVKPVIHKDALKKADDALKLAKEMTGGEKTPESEKLAKQLKLSEATGDVKVKVVKEGKTTQITDAKALEKSSAEKLLQLQEQDAEKLAAEETKEGESLLKKAEASGQKSDFTKVALSQKGTVATPDFTTSSVKPSVLSESVPLQGQIQNPQAVLKGEGAQVPVYTSSQQTAMVTQVSQGMLAAKQEGLTKFFIQMNPPELGKVLIDIQIKGGQVKAVFSANKETLNLLKEDSESLRDSLKAMGVDSDSELEFSLLGDEGQAGGAFENAHTPSSSKLYPTSMEDAGDPQVLDLRGMRLDRENTFHEVA